MEWFCDNHYKEACEIEGGEIAIASHPNIFGNLCVICKEPATCLFFPPEMYTCSMCECRGFCRPEEEAEAELKAEFGDVDKSECDVVCDDCWEKVRPTNNPDVFSEWKKD